MATDPPPRTGAVVIGYNGGERFKRCIASLLPQVQPIVYVDSGSTDDSVIWSQTQGVEVVHYDADQFFAGLARNLGFQRLQQLVPELEFVHFFDADVIVDPGWIDTAVQALNARPDWALVCGETREENPHLSPYNRWHQLQWDRPPGPVEDCEGTFMVRAAAFAQVGQFAPRLGGGIEAEFCHRLRQAGFQLGAIEALMVHHDAQCLRFGLWWRRREREGFWFLTAAQRYQVARFRRLKRSVALWTGTSALGAIDAGVSWLAGRPLAGLLLGLIGLAQSLRLVGHLLYARHHGWRTAWAHSWLTLLGDWPLLRGMLRYWRNKY